MENKTEIFNKLVNENQNKRSFSGIIISVVTIICILSLLGLTIYFVKDSGVIPKKTVEFEDLFNRKFIPRLVDVQWSSKSNVMYYFDNETNIISYNADRNDTEILLSRNYIFSFNITNFWVSFSGKYILMKSVTSKNNRHSTLGIYYIYNLIIGNIYTFPNKQKTSHLLLAKWAPNFDKIVYVKNTDIFISHLKKDLIINVSQEKINDLNLIKNGISDWLYEEDVTNDINQNWWSPDGNYLAYIRFNMTYEPLFNYSIYQTTIPNDRWGYIEHQRYPIPHDPNIKILPITHVYIYHKTTKKIEFNLPYEDGNYYIYTNNWLNNTCLRTTFVDRAQKEYISYIVNILPDDSFKVIMENKEYSQIGWIDVPKNVIIYSNYSYLSIMPKAELNSEDIWNHVALINLESSHRNLKFLTSGRYDIISLVKLDKFRNILYVLSTGGDSKNQLLSRIDIPQSLKNFVDGSLENLLVDESDKYLCSYAKAKFSYNGNYHFMSCLGPNIPTFYVRSFSKKKVFIESNNECKKNLAQYDYYPKINYARIKRDNNIDIYMDIRQPQNNDTDLHPVLFYVPTVISFTESNEEIMEILFKELDHYEYNLFAIYNDFIKNSINEKPKLADIPENSENLNMDKEIIFCKETLKKIELITSLLFDHYFISLSKYMGILNVSLDIQSNLSQPEFYIDIKSGFEFPMLIGQKMIKWEKEKVNLNAKILGIHKKSTLKNENDKLYIPLYGNIKQGTEWKKIEISMLIKDPIDGQESKVNGLFYDEKLDVIIPRTLSNTKHPLKPVEIKLTFDDLNNERIEIERYYSGLDYFIIGIRKYLVQFVIECENFKIIERIEGTEGADDQNPEIEELSLIKLDEFYKRFCSFKYNFKKRIGNVLYNPYIYYLLENFDKYLTEFVNDFVKEAHRCSSLCSNFCIQSKNISNMFREQFMDIYVCTSDSKMVSKSSIEALESLKAKFKKIGENLVLKYKTTLYKKCINLDEIFTKMNTIKVSHRSLIKILLSNVKNGHANHFYLYIKDKEFSHAGLETNVAENETSALAKLLSNVLNILNSNQNQNLNDKNKSKSNSETKIDNVSIVGKYLKDFSTCTHESNIQKYLSTYNIEHDYKVGNLFIGQISYIFNILWTNIINDGKKTTDIVHGFINKFCVDLQEKIEKINKIDKIAKSSSNNVNSLDHYQKNFNENQSNVSYFVQNLFDNFTKTISSFIEDRTLDKLNKIRELELFYRNENIKEKFEIFLNIGYQDIKNGTMEFIGNVIKNYVKFFESLNGIDSLDSNSDFDSYYEFASNLKELNIWANNYVQNIQILPSNEFLSQNLTFLLKYLLKLELVSHQISIIHQEGLCRSWTDKTNKLLKFNLKLTKFCQFYYISQMGDALKNSCQDLVDEDNKLYIKSLNLLISSITDSTQNIIFSLKIPLSTSWLSNFHEIWEKYKNIPFKLITEQPPTHLTPTDTKNYMEEYIKIYKNTRETIIGKYTQRFESISIDLSQEILEIQLNKKIYHYTPIQVDELLKTIIMQNKTISNEIISIHTKKMANYLQNLIMQCHYKIKLENKLIYMYKNVSNLQISSKIMKNYLDRDLTPIFEMEHDILKLNNLHQNINESTAEVFIESMTLCRHAMEKMCTMVELKCFNLLKLSANEINLINHRNQFIYTLNSLKDVENHEIFTDIYIKHVNDKEQSQIHLIYIEKLLLFHYYKFIENVNLIKFVLNLFKKNLSKSKLDSVDAVNGLFNLLILNVGNQIKVSKENTVSCHSFLEQDSNIIQKNFKLNETALSDTINLIKIEENNLIENEFIIQKNFLNQQFLIDSDSTKIVNADNPNECQKLLNNLEKEKNQFIDRLNFNKEKSFESLSNRLDCLRGKFNQDSKNELDIKNRIQHESRIKSMVCNFIENK
ncbi:hypothetical protein A3Q56_05402, partial [Intoshia linei]